MKSISLLIIVLVLFSCKKALNNVEDYFPRVTFSAVKLNDGSVLVNGTLVEEGASEVDVVGFCYSDTPDFSISSNQIIVTDKSDFQATYPAGFDPTKTYYFKAFAANSYGRAESNVVSISNIASQPILAPCTLNANTYQAGNTGNINSFSPSYQSFNEVTYPCSGTSLVIMNTTFSSPPLTGVYTTTINTPGPGEVRIFSNIGFSNGLVIGGAEVYVNRLSETQFKVEVCSAQVNYNGTNFPFKVHFIRNY